MLFLHTWRKIVTKEKIATRRLWVQYDYGRVSHWSSRGQKDARYSAILTDNGRTRYNLGQHIPVMPARGKKGVKSVANIIVSQLWSHDVRRIMQEDLVKEGFLSQDADPETCSYAYIHFLQLWCEMYDPEPLALLPEGQEFRYEPFLEAVKLRPHKLYTAAVIEWEPTRVSVYPDAVEIAIGLPAPKLRKAKPKIEELPAP